MKWFKAIAAMSRNRVIGRANRIPWPLPEDFEWFKRMTTGQVIVMGRKTFESIGKPFSHRTTMVLTRSQFTCPGVETIADSSQIDPSKETKDIFICGGAEVYRLALPFCSDLYLTLVKRGVEGDTFFPPLRIDSNWWRTSSIIQNLRFSITAIARPNPCAWHFEP